jgi:hypothetical protein
MNLKAYWKKYYNHTELHRRYNYVIHYSLSMGLGIFITLPSEIYDVGCSEGGKITANEVLDQNSDAVRWEYL